MNTSGAIIGLSVSVGIALICIEGLRLPSFDSGKGPRLRRSELP